VKYAIPLGTILLVGIAAGLHRSPSQPMAGDLCELSQKTPARVEAELRPDPEFLEPAAIPQPEPVELRKRSETVSVAPSALSSRKQLQLLEREVILTTIQQIAVEQALRDREDEIKAWHEGIRRAGLIDIRHYEWQVGLMKEAWFRKIDAVLDREQHEQLVVLVGKGFLNEGLAFTVEPGMTVLD
jgi:hypothetical protein